MVLSTTITLRNQKRSSPPRLKIVSARRESGGGGGAEVDTAVVVKEKPKSEQFEVYRGSLTSFGATACNGGLNFAIFSANAVSATLCLISLFDLHDVFRRIATIFLSKIQFSLTKLKDVLLATWESPYVITLAFTCGLSSFTNSYIAATVSQSHKEINEEIGFFDSNYLLFLGVIGAIAGTSITIFMSDYLGRLWGLRVQTTMLFIGTLVMANADYSKKFLTGRFVIAVAFGISWVLNPLYITEAVPPQIHNSLIALDGLFVTLGQSLSHFIKVKFLEVGHRWKWMILLAGIPINAQFIMTLMLVDSPFWLYRQGKVKECEDALKCSWPESEVEEALKKLKTLVNQAKVSETSMIKKIKLAWGDAKIRLLISRTTVLLIIQQLAGLKYIHYYGLKLQRYGQNSGAASFLGSPVGDLFCLIFLEGLGPKILLSISTFGITLCLLTSTFVCRSEFGSSKILKLTIYELYSFFYFIGYGDLPRVVGAEIYQSPFRDLGATGTAIFYWLISGVSTYTFRITFIKYKECSVIIVISILTLICCFVLRGFVLTRF